MNEIGGFLVSETQARLYRSIMDSIKNIPIVIAGSARSGTTWVQELICSDAKNIGIFEPLNSKFIPEAAKFEYKHSASLFDRRDAEEFYNRIFSRRLLSKWTTMLYSKKVIFLQYQNIL